MLVWIISSHMERRVNQLLRENYESLRNDKDYLAAKYRYLKNASPETLEVGDTLVGCSSCGKWRMLPPDISAEEVEALPDEWYCADNIWDPERSNCNAPEETNSRVMAIYFERKKQAEERMADQSE